VNLDGNDATELLAIARTATRAAGQITLGHAHGKIVDKGDRDFVSEADLAAEHAVRELLQNKTPDIPILGEEQGGPNPSTGLVWVVDPIDGTVNYLQGLPTFAVTLSLLAGGEAALAATYLPETDAMYTAVQGQGSFLNGQRLAASTTASLREAVIAIDQFTFIDDDPQAMNDIRLGIIQALVPVVHRLRIYGASAVDLAWVAQGKLDGCIILANKPWDTSGGVLISREAEAIATDIEGAPHCLDAATTVVASERIAKGLLSTISPPVLNNVARRLRNPWH
jgi:myo-inositol-1(or 4)-monophosphatase